jgi:hypothetical protein
LVRAFWTAAGEGSPIGRRVHTVHGGQGRGAWPERLETEVVGITGLTTYDQYGTPEHRRQANRRDFQANPLNAVVVHQWQGKDYGPGGEVVFLTNASVDKRLRPFDHYDDCSLVENFCVSSPRLQDEAKRHRGHMRLLTLPTAPSRQRLLLPTQRVP